MQQRIHHLLFACLLFWAQVFAVVHAVEHVSNDAIDAPHVCSLCLATHDLGTALGSSASALPVLAAHDVPAIFHLPGRSSQPAPQPRQQSPPLL